MQEPPFAPEHGLGVQNVPVQFQEHAHETMSSEEFNQHFDLGQGQGQEGGGEHQYDDQGDMRASYDQQQYDQQQYDQQYQQYDQQYQQQGYDQQYDQQGYEQQVYDQQGYDQPDNQYGYDQQGYDQQGYDQPQEPQEPMDDPSMF